VESVQGKRPSGADAHIKLDFMTFSDSPASAAAQAGLPAAWIAEPKQRIEAYRRLAEAATREEVSALRASWRDRYGPVPIEAERALTLAEVRIEAARRRIALVEVRAGKVMLTRGGTLVLVGGRFPRLTSSGADSSLRELLSTIESLPAR
jgi:transcription-repair coupling factor (superfamily II helicase)